MRDFLSEDCMVFEPPEFRTYGPTGDLGYLCMSGTTLWAFDGRVIATSPDYPLVFLDDGRVVVHSSSGAEIASANGEGPRVPLEYEGKSVWLGAAQRVGDSTVFVTETATQEDAASLLRLEGEAVVLEEQYPPHGLATRQFAIDRAGRVTLLGRRKGDDHIVVLRLDPNGNQVIYDTPEDSDPGHVWPMPESSGAFRVDRLIAPL